MCWHVCQERCVLARLSGEVRAGTSARRGACWHVCQERCVLARLPGEVHAGTSARRGACWHVCQERCVLARLPGEVCAGTSARRGVCWHVCQERCVLARLPGEVCAGTSTRRGACCAWPELSHPCCTSSKSSALLYRLGTSPLLRMLLMSSRKDSTTTCVSVKRNTVGLFSAPALK